MSAQDFLKKLLNGAVVEWNRLDGVGEFQRGKRFVKKDMLDKGTPCIHYGEMYTHYGVWADDAKSYVDSELALKLRVARPGDVVIVAAGETIEDIGNGTAWLGKEEVVIHDACFSYRSWLDAKYVSYFFRTTAFKQQIRSSISSGKISSINARGLGQATIPVPCPDDPDRSLAIQAEIVRILDSFTELTAELTAELTVELENRRKQYEFYSRELLSFGGDDAEWTTLGEIASIGTGSKNTNEAVPNGRYPFFVRSQEPRAIDEFEFDETAIITAGDGVGVGKVFHYMSGKYALHQRAYRIVVTDSRVLSKYLFHYIRKNFGHYLRQTSVHASVTSLRMPMFQKYPVPIPKEEGKQARIIATLDRFDAVIASLGDALPGEIELRQLQYEYYRDLLFSFPKTEEAA